MNIRIEFLYRDASNYKRWSEVVFLNPGNLSAAEVWSEISEATRQWQLFEDAVHFRPELVGLQTCYFTDAGYAGGDDDLELHEVHRVVETEVRCTEVRTILEFLQDLRSVGGAPAVRGGSESGSAFYE